MFSSRCSSRLVMWMVGLILGQNLCVFTAQSFGQLNRESILGPGTEWDLLSIRARSKDDKIRGQALSEICKLGEPDSIDLLMASFEEKPDVIEASELMDGIVKIGPAIAPRIREIYVELAYLSGHNQTRAFALQALGSLKDREALPLLIQVASDSSLRESRAFECISAALGLGLLGDPAATPILSSIIQSCDPHADGNLIAACLISIGRIDNNDADDLLANIANENDRVYKFYRAYAAWALGKHGDSRAVEPLARVLEYHGVIEGYADWCVKDAAKFMLDFDDNIAGEALVRFSVSETDEWATSAALEWVKRHGSARVLPMLRDASSSVRCQAANILRKGEWEIDDPAEKAWFLTAILGPYESDRPDLELELEAWNLSQERFVSKARQELIEMAELAVEPLLYAVEHLDEPKSEFFKNSFMYTEQRHRIFSCLASVADDRAIPVLLKVMQSDSDATVQGLAIMGLAKAHAVQHAKDIASFLKIWKVSQYAALALRQLAWTPDTEADKVRYAVGLGEWEELMSDWETAKAVLKRDLYSTDPRVSENAAMAFFRLGRDDCVVQMAWATRNFSDTQIIKSFLNSEVPELKKAAEDWAKAHNYNIVNTPNVVAEKWGSAR